MSDNIEKTKTLLFHCRLRISRLEDELAVLQNALRELNKLQTELQQTIDDDHARLVD